MSDTTFGAVVAAYQQLAMELSALATSAREQVPEVSPLAAHTAVVGRFSASYPRVRRTELAARRTIDFPEHWPLHAHMVDKGVDVAAKRYVDLGFPIPDRHWAAISSAREAFLVAAHASGRWRPDTLRPEILSATELAGRQLLCAYGNTDAGTRLPLPNHYGYLTVSEDGAITGSVARLLLIRDVAMGDLARALPVRDSRTPELGGRHG